MFSHPIEAQDNVQVLSHVFHDNKGLARNPIRANIHSATNSAQNTNSLTSGGQKGRHSGLRINKKPSSRSQGGRDEGIVRPSVKQNTTPSARK
jgi:hypothetical protein